jgi:ParB family transcriptional regulator, chromosome partitioning protein
MVKGGLGKGLSALIADKHEPLQALPATPTVVTSERDTLPLDKLRPGKYQPRTRFSEQELQELSESIRKNGVVQPILVRKADADGMYDIVAGERRWRASNLAGLRTIPAIVMELTDRQSAEIALVENIQRKDLNMLEEAEGYQRLIQEFDYTQEQLAEAIGKSRSQITNTLRLLSLPQRVKQMLEEDKISGGHARAILSAQDPVTVAEIVAKRDLNVRQTEKLVKKLSSEPRATTRKITLKDPEIRQLEAELSKKLGLELSVLNKGEAGKIIITYRSIAELDSVLRRLDRDI